VRRARPRRPSTPCAEDPSPSTPLTRPARDTLSQKTAPSLRIQGTWEKRPARDTGGPLSHLVPGFLDSDQAGLEDPDAGLRVTSAHSCPNFPGFVLLAQQLPERGLRVTSPPKPVETPPGAVAGGTPAAADAPPHESPADPSRVEAAPCASAAQDHTPASSSSGSLQPIDGGDTTSGSTGTVSARSSSLSPSTQRRRRPRVQLSADYSAARSDTWGGSILASRPGSLLESA
jgi:hypothetical protein